MAKIPIDSIKPDYFFDKNVYVDAYNVFKMKYQIIRERDISILRQWQIDFLFTEGEMKHRSEMPDGEGTEDSDEVEVPDDAVVVEVPEGVNIGYYAQLIAAAKQEAADYYADVIRPLEGIIDIPKYYLEAHMEAKTTLKRLFDRVRNNDRIAPAALEDVVAKLAENIDHDRTTWIFIATFSNRGDFLINHAVNSTIFALMLGLALDYKLNNLYELGIGCMLQDIGMATIPSYILEKEGPLTPKEIKLIKSHPEIGYKIVSHSARASREIIDIVYKHQETSTGDGYPQGLKSSELSEAVKIVGMVKVYTAMIKPRIYRKPITPFAAMKSIVSKAGQYNPELVKLMVTLMSLYPVGSFVMLSDDRLGVVMSSNYAEPVKPHVKILFDSNGNPATREELISIANQPDLKIVQAIPSSEYLDIKKRKVS